MDALGSEKKLDEVLSLPFEEIVRMALRMIVQQIRSLNRSIAELEKTIGEAGSKLDRHKGLLSIRGIGKINSAILLSVIGDVKDFDDEGHLQRPDLQAGNEVGADGGAIVVPAPARQLLSIAERCSTARVRYDRGKSCRALASCALATGGSGGNQMLSSFFVLRKTKTRL
jgi:hypothetical protein